MTLKSHAFGVVDKTIIWTMPVGPFHTANLVCDSLVNSFAEGKPGYVGSFSVRPIIKNELLSGVFSILFAQTPPWVSKDILIGKVKRLISSEPEGKCKLCGLAGHGSWECKEEWPLSLGEVGASGTLGGTGVQGIAPDVQMAW